MKAVARFHLLYEPRRSAQRTILEDVEGVDGVFPSLPFLRGNRRRHGNLDVAGLQADAVVKESWMVISTLKCCYSAEKQHRSTH